MGYFEVIDKRAYIFTMLIIVPLGFLLGFVFCESLIGGIVTSIFVAFGLSLLIYISERI